MSCNVVSASSRELDSFVTLYIESEDEEVEKIIYLAHIEVPMVAATRSCKPYHKNYNDPVAKPSQPLKRVRPSARLSTDKAKEKEPCNDQPQEKDKANDPSLLFCFNVLTQLANILERIILYELLALSKNILKALQETLANAECWIDR